MTGTTARNPVRDDGGSMWASGLSLFAAWMMMILGTFQFFEGLVAVVDGDDFLLNTPNYLVQFDASTWGWTHLILGAIVAVTGVAIMTGNKVARGFGIFFVALSAFANFLWIPYYPLWALVVLTLDVAVIWALTTSDLSRR